MPVLSQPSSTLHLYQGPHDPINYLAQLLQFVFLELFLHVHCVGLLVPLSSL